MTKEKSEYRKDVAFINREQELKFLHDYIDMRPESIIFIHGPKSSGKTTLLYKFLEQVEKEKKLDVKFMNLRRMSTELTDEYNYHDFLKMLFNVQDKDRKEKKGKVSGGINVGFFKIDSEIERNMKKGRVDPFMVMEREFNRLHRQGIKPVFIIDELQALEKIYIMNGKDKRLIIELFNFFVAMTKESHLAHIIIASSDGYFLNTVYNDSKLKKCSAFYKVDYLDKEDVMEWLLHLEKYSKIKDYTLTAVDAEKIWNAVGGSMWEIQYILTELFSTPLDEALTIYKKKIKGMIEYYIGTNMLKEKMLAIFVGKETARIKDFARLGIDPEILEGLLQDMVSNNILYFDPADALYYPQGESYLWGIKLYFESI